MDDGVSGRSWSGRPRGTPERRALPHCSRWRLSGGTLFLRYHERMYALSDGDRVHGVRRLPDGPSCPGVSCWSLGQVVPERPRQPTPPPKLSHLVIMLS
ncbi:MAG: hypothetical protein QOJ19_4460 [Acidimicrobiia bacterium]|jgi:hypothetical protein|nr:hypothetical protein [Acidimicrobiia bacterium]